MLTDYGPDTVIPCVQNLPQNQCVFVRGFCVKRMENSWSRLRGAPDFGERVPESGRGLELIDISAADTDVCRHCQHFLLYSLLTL